MKHIKIFVFLVVILLPCLCLARMNSYIAGAATTCTWQYVAKNVQEGTGDERNFNSAASANKAISFVANGTYTPRRYTTQLKKNNSPTVTMEFIIRQDAGESTSRTYPGTVITDAQTYAAASLETTYTTITIDVPAEDSAELTNGNVYWFQIYGGANSSNYVKWLIGTTGSEQLEYNTAPPTETEEGWIEDADTSMTGNFTIWSYECL